MAQPEHTSPTVRTYIRRHDTPCTFSLRTHFKTFSHISELYVSPAATRFLVHRDLLTYHSPFFGAALTGTFAEGLSQSIKLPEEDLLTFELFICWLYSQRLEPTSYFKDGKPTFYKLLHLYSLADRLCVERLRNQTVDWVAALADSTNSVLTPSDTHILYNLIRDSAPLRRLILDLFAFKKTDKLLAEHPGDWHPVFLRELVVKLKRPDATAMQRHNLVPWTPAAWHSTKACGTCNRLVPPGSGGSECRNCSRAYCGRCVTNGKGLCCFEEGRDMCKPWKGEKQRCMAYHEHNETPPCQRTGGAMPIEQLDFNTS